MVEGLFKSFKVYNYITPKSKGHSQLTFAYSKSTIETLEKGMKYIQS